MNFDIENVLPTLEFNEEDFTAAEEKEEVDKQDNKKDDSFEEINITNEDILNIDKEVPDVKNDNKVSTLLYQELVEKGVAAKIDDKDEFSWDDIDGAFKQYTEDLPLKVAQALIDSLPEEGKGLMNYLLSKQANLTKEDLQTYYKDYLTNDLITFETDDDARNFLKEQYKGKFRASQVNAMLDTLEDEDDLINEANKVKEEMKKEKERVLETEKQSKLNDQKEFVNSLASEFNTLDWNKDRIERVKQSIVSGEGNAKLAKIAQTPNGLIHLYNFMTYFDESNGKFNLSDFANITTSKQAKRLKDSLTEDMLTSASSSTKGANRSGGSFDFSKLQPIID